MEPNKNNDLFFPLIQPSKEERLERQHRVLLAPRWRPIDYVPQYPGKVFMLNVPPSEFNAKDPAEKALKGILDLLETMSPSTSG